MQPNFVENEPYLAKIFSQICQKTIKLWNILLKTLEILHTYLYLKYYLDGYEKLLNF